MARRQSLSFDRVRQLAALWRPFPLRWRARKAAIWPRLRIEHLLLAAGLAALLLLVDEPVARALARLPRWIIVTGRVVTQLGLSFYMLVIAAGVALVATIARNRGAGRGVDAGLAVVAERAIYVFTSVAVAGILAQIAKHLVGRARPRFIDTLGPLHFQLLDFHASRNSFPSGHAANAFALAAALGVLWPRRRSWLLAAACLIGLSRVIVHAHYISDVAGGALLGFCSAYAVALIFAARGTALRQAAGALVPRGRLSVAALVRILARRLPVPWLARRSRG